MTNYRKTLIMTANYSNQLGDALKNCSDHFRPLSEKKGEIEAYIVSSVNPLYLSLILKQQKGHVNGYNTIFSTFSLDDELNFEIARRFKEESGIQFGPPTSNPLIAILLELGVSDDSAIKNHDKVRENLKRMGI